MADVPTPEPTTDEDHRPVRPFADFLRELDNGRVHEDLGEALNALTLAIEATGKGGTVALTLTVKPLDKGNTKVLVITDAVTLKAPRAERKAAIFYPDRDGNLHRNDPSQLAFESLREVPTAPAAADRPLREVN